MECGFLSNPKEAEKLQESSYQEKLAEAIYHGICDFLEENSGEDSRKAAGCENGKKCYNVPMDTKYYRLTNQSSDKEIYQEAGRIIRAGGLVAFPTETVYGLGGDAENPLASRKIYEAKGRPSDNPLIVHIAEISQLKEIASHLPKEAEKLAEAFWPGPLTMIVDKNDRIPPGDHGRSADGCRAHAQPPGCPGVYSESAAV